MKRRNPTCCAIVPAHNAGQYVAESIRSLLDQTLAPHRIVVVDDGSTDSTASALAPLQNRIELIRQPASGASAARNRALEAVDADYIAFLDADDICETRRLEKQIAALEAEPAAAMVFCAVSFIDATGAPIGGVMRCPAYNRMGFFGLSLVRNRIPTASAVVARREAIRTAGGFDEAIAFNEEYDLWLRIARRSPVLYVDEPLIRYRIHAANVSRNREQQRRNEALALQKHSLEEVRDAIEAAYPEPGESPLALARVFFRMNRFDDAARALHDLQSAGCEDPSVHFYLGNVHIMRGERKRAEEEFRQAVLMNGSFACAHNNLGVLLAAKGQPEEARQAFEIARGLRLEYSDPAVNLQILRTGGDPQTMRLTFNRLRETLRPEFDTSRGGTGA